MVRRFARWLAVVLLIQMSGGHLLLLQTVAWGGMTISFAQTERLTAALKKTFDGKHPCKLCRMIAEEKKSDKKKELQQFETKIDFLCEVKALALFPPAFDFVSLCFSALQPRTESPPTPPPRNLLG